MLRIDEPHDLYEIVPAILGIIEDGPAPTDCADFEYLAATVDSILDQPEIPPDLPAAAVDALERRDDAAAAGLLTALRVLGHEALRAPAAAAVERLAARGVSFPAADRIGTLAVEEAVRFDHDGGRAAMLIVMLRRPRARKRQVALLGIEYADSGGALVDCVIMPPVSAADARELMYDDLEDAGPAEPVDLGALPELVVAAAERTVQMDMALSAESAPSLPIVSLALTGDPEGLARPEFLAPWDGDDDLELVVDAEEDEDGYLAVVDMLLDELEAHAREHWRADPVVADLGDFVARTMLEYKGGYGDGVLGRWTPADLEGYLLRHVPRTLSLSEDDLAAVPHCAAALLRFLDARGSLSGAPLPVLEEACDELAPALAEIGADPAHWGLGKSVGMQMLAEGVDPGDQKALDRWMADFNARPRAERDATIGGPMDRMFESSQTEGGHAGGRSTKSPKPAAERRAKRKAQKAGRKRSRGR